MVLFFFNKYKINYHKSVSNKNNKVRIKKNEKY